MAFFDTQLDLQDSDEDRIDFAKFYLEDLRFLYKDSENGDKKVCDPKHDPSSHYYINLKMTFNRHGRDSFGVPSSSKLLPLILVLSRVL